MKRNGEGRNGETYILGDPGNNLLYTSMGGRARMFRRVNETGEVVIFRG